MRGIEFLLKAKDKTQGVFKKIDSNLSVLKQKAKVFGKQFLDSQKQVIKSANTIQADLKKVEQIIGNISKLKGIRLIPQFDSVKRGFNQIRKKYHELTQKKGVVQLVPHFDKAKNSIADLNKKLQKLQKEKEVSVSKKKIARLNREIDKTEKALNKLTNTGRKIDVDSSSLQTAKTLILSVGVALGALTIGANVVSSFQHLKKVSSQVRVEQGLLQQTLGVTGKALTQTTSKSQAMTKVFKVENQDLIAGVSALKNAYEGMTNVQAFEFIKQGCLSGANAHGGFIDKLKEYPTFFAQAGLSAKESIAFMSIMPKLGIYSDKGADTIKESVLRLKEMPKAAGDALKQLFAVSAKNGGLKINVEQFKKGLKTGEISAIGASRTISKALQHVDKQTRQVVLADVFGGAGEDAGKFVDKLHEIDLNLDKQVDKMNPLVAKQMKQLKLQENLSSEAQKFAPLFNKMSDSGDSFFGTLQLKAYQMVNDLQPTFETIGKYIENPLIPTIEKFFDKVRLGVASAQNNWLKVRTNIETVGIVVLGASAIWATYSNRVAVSNAIDKAKLVLTRLKSSSMNFLNLQTLRQNALTALSTIRMGANNAMTFSRLLITGQLGAAMQMLNLRQTALNAKTLLSTVITGGFSGAMTLLNATLYANPIGLVILAIASFTGMIALAYNRSEKFRQIVWGLWGATKIVFAKIWELAKKVFEPMLKLFDLVGNALVSIFDRFEPTKAGKKTKGFFGEIIEGFTKGAKEREKFENAEKLKEKTKPKTKDSKGTDLLSKGTELLGDTFKNKASTDAIFTGKTGSSDFASASGLSGGGGGGKNKKVYHVNINIHTLVGEQNFRVSNQMDAEMVGEAVKNELLRAVNGVNEVVQ